MEEDIKVLEELKETYITSGLYQIGTFELSDEQKQAIENLIKGYKELEKENKTLKGFTSSIFNDTLEKDYIPKSRVIEIIEDIDNNQPVIAQLKLRKLVEGDK